MNRFTVIMLTTLAATHVRAEPPAGVASNEPEVARLLAFGGEGFRVHRTEHFLVASDGEDTTVRELTGRLEGAYQAVARFCETMKLSIHPPLQRLPVLFFNRHSDSMRYARAVGFEDPAAPGFYHSGNNMAAFANVLDFPQLREISQRIEQAETQRDPSMTPERIAEWRSQRDALVETFNRLVIQHEAAHQVFFNIGVLSRDADNPDWLVEGLACQFEVLQHDAMNQMRLADFREALGVAPNVVNIDESVLLAARSNGRFLTLADLVSDNVFNVADDTKRPFRYAQAWGLVHFLHHERGESFAVYLRRIAAPPLIERTEKQYPIAEFESVFGPPEASFDRAWVDYVLRLPFNPSRTGQ